MDIAEIARKVLVDLWEYGRVVLIVVSVVAIWGLFLRRFAEEGDEDHSQTFGLLRIALTIVGGFAALSFLNLQLGNMLVIARANPAWGALTLSVVLLLALTVTFWVYRGWTYRVGNANLSVTKAVQPNAALLHDKIGKVAFLIITLMTAASIIWLWTMAN